jgi:hypothetical protein
MSKKKKKSKKVPVGTDLYRETDCFAFSCFGTKEEITLFLSQGSWQEDKKDVRTTRSMHEVKTDACGTEVRLPVESARQLFHALGCVLEED